MRIIAGQYKGRKLLPPADNSIRPTLAATRESVFNLLMHGQFGGDNIIGEHVVDLCCGTGAMGLEALSRGARIATFIDKDRKSLELAKQNALHCGASQQSFFVSADATRLPPAKEVASLVMFDAPYDKPILLPSYESLKAGGWLKAGTLLVAEQQRYTEVPALEGTEIADNRKYGKTNIVIYRVL